MTWMDCRMSLNIHCSNVGSIGFCMGGGLSLALASRMSSTPHALRAAVTCYGTPPSELFEPRLFGSQRTAIQGHFGGKVSKLSLSLVILETDM